MKKTFLLLSAATIVFLTSCGSNTNEKAKQDDKSKTDSVGEQKKLDSLFNAAGKNMSGTAKDSSLNK